MGNGKGSRIRGAYKLKTLPDSQRGNLSRSFRDAKVSANYEEIVLLAAGPVGLATYEWILEYRDCWSFFLCLSHSRKMSAKAAAKKWLKFVEDMALKDFVHVQGKQASGNPDHHILLVGTPDKEAIEKAWKGQSGGKVYLEPIRNLEGAAAYLCTRNRNYLPIVEMTK
jgi:hypothetical protein